MICLDTDVLSELMRPQPSPGLRSRLAEVPVGDQSTTSITLGEIAYGAMRAERPELYDRALTLLGGIAIFAFGEEAARQYGAIRASLEREGRRLPDPDLRIGAIALAYGLVLVTGNLRHFARIPGLTAEDWIRA